MNSSSKNITGDEKWTKCEPGKLSQYAAASVRPATTATSLKVVGLSLAVACGFVAIFFSTSSWMHKDEVEKAGFPYKGGLTCTVVLDSMPAYFDATLDAEAHSLTIQHLLDCPPCLAKYEQEAAARGVEVDLTLAAVEYSPVMDWPSQPYGSLSIVAQSGFSAAR